MPTATHPASSCWPSWTDAARTCPFEAAVADFPAAAMNARAPNVPYTPWHLVEHLRLTQRDMIEYVSGPDYATALAR